MIITITPNPSIDHTIALGTPLRPGAVHRIAEAQVQPAGKGVNISRAAQLAGAETLAVVVAPPESEYVADLRHLGVPLDVVPSEHPVRLNITVTEPDGTTTKFNDRGPAVDSETLHALRERVVAGAAEASWLVLAGSLPAGCAVDWYAELIRELRPTGVSIALDTSNAPLAAVIGALPDAAPALIKPNGAELASLTGDDADELEADPIRAAEAARSLVDRGIREVLVSLGATGAVLVNAEGAWFATPPPIMVASTVGAGDCSLFGYLRADQRGASPAGRLADAVAYGSAAASLPGTQLPRPDETHPELVRTHELSENRWKVIR